MSAAARAALEAHGIPAEPEPGSYQQVLEDAIADVLATGHTRLEPGGAGLVVDMDWNMDWNR